MSDRYLGGWESGPAVVEETYLGGWEPSDPVAPPSNVPGAAAVVSPRPVLPEMQQALDEEIARAPIAQQEQMETTVKAAIAIHQALGVPFSSAFQEAKALTAVPTSQVEATTFANVWEVNKIDTRISALWDAARKGTEAEEAAIMLRIRELEKQRPNVDMNDAGLLKRLVGVVSQMKETTLGVVPQEMAQDAILSDGTPLGERLRKLFGAGGSFLWGIGRVEGGSTYGYLRERGVDREIANRAADFTSSINTGIEIGGNIAFGALLGVFGSAGRAVLPEVFKKFSTNSIKNAMARVAVEASKKMAEGTISNAGEEFAQGMVTTVAQRLAIDAENAMRGTTGDHIPKPEYVDAISEWLQGLPTYAAMGLLPAGSAVGRFAAGATVQKATALVESALGETEAPVSEQIQTRIAETMDEIASVRQAAAESETDTPVDLTAQTEKLRGHATEIDTALDAKVEEISAAPEITNEAMAEIMTLAQTKDAVQREIVKLQPQEAPAVTPADPFTTDIRAAIRTNLPQFSEREVTAAGLVVDFRARRDGVETSEYVARTFAPGVFAAPEVAQATIAQGQNANAAVSFLEDGKALIHAAEQTDFKALVHEFAHVFRRQLSEVEQASIASTFGTGVDAEERFAEGFVKFLQTGETEQAELAPLYAELSDLLGRFRVDFDDVIPDETRAVFDSILGGPRAVTAETTGPETLFNPMALKPMETERATGRRSSVTIGNVTLTRDQLSRIDPRLPDVMESNIRGNNKAGLLAALRDMDMDLFAASEPGKQAALQAITTNVEATDIDAMSVRARGPGNRPDLLFNTAFQDEQESRYETARDFDSPEEYAAMAQTMDLDPKTEAEYNAEWEAAQNTTPSRERATARFLGSIETKEGLETLLMELWRAEAGQPKLGTMQVHQLFQNAVDKAPSGLSDAAYKKLMDQIRNDPTKYRTIIAKVLGDERMQEQIAREKFVDPDAAALEREKEANRELRRTNASLGKSIADMEKDIEGWKRSTMREGVRADFAAERAGDIAKRALGERIVAKAAIRDLLDQIREEQQAQVEIIGRAEYEYEQAVKEGKAEVIAARREERDKAKAKMDAIRARLTAALDEQKQKLQDYKNAVRTKEYAGRVLKSIMREPTTAMLLEWQDKISAVQQTIVASGFGALEKAREAVRKWQAANPGKPLTAAAQKVMDLRSVREMTVTELEAVRDEVDRLRTIGRQASEAWKAADRQTKRQWKTDVMVSLRKLKPGRTVPEIAAGKEFAKARKTGGPELFSWVNASVRRWAEWLDDGKSGPVYRLTVGMTDEAAKTEVANKLRRTKAIDDQMAALKLKPSHFMRTFKIEGQTFNKNEAMAVYLLMKNESARAHLTAMGEGKMNISPARAAQFIAQLSPKEQQFGDFILSTFQGKDKERLRRFANDVLNLRFVEEDNYFPVRVTDRVYETHAQQVADDVLSRSGIRRAGVRKGMIKARTGSTARIVLNAFGTLNDAIEKHEHLLAFQKPVEILNSVFNDPEVQAEIVRAEGTEAMKIIKEWIGTVATPEESSRYDPVLDLTNKLRSNIVLAGLMGNIPSYAKQAPVIGPWINLQDTNTPRMMAAIGEWTAHSRRLYNFVVARDPEIADRVLDPVFSEVSRKTWSKSKTVIDRTKSLLTAVFNQFDLATVLIAWKAVYSHNMAINGGDDVAASTAAHDAIWRRQPQGKGKDMPAILRSQIGRWASLYGNQLNQMYQTAFFDLPMTMKDRDLTAYKRVLWATRWATGLAITGILMGIVARKRLPEPEEAALDVASQFISPVPLGIGSAVQSVADGWSGSPLGITTPFVETATDVARAVKTAIDPGADLQKKILATLRVVPDALRIIGGPSVLAKRAMRAALEGNAWWLVGGPPEERD